MVIATEGTVPDEAVTPKSMTAEEAALPENQPEAPKADPKPEASDDETTEADATPSIIDSDEEGDREAQDDATPKPIAELSLPDESPLAEKHLADLKEFATEAGLTDKQAKLLLDRDNSMAETQRTAWEDHTETVRADWYGELKADPEYGKTFESNNAGYNSALKAIWPGDEYPEVAKLLQESGYEYWPPFVKGLAAFARKHLAEPSTHVPGETPKQVPDDVALAQRRFPNSPEMWGGKSRRTA